MWYILLYALLSVLGIAMAAIAGYYTIFALAKANILWTEVKQGWCKIILKWGKYKKTVKPGLRWIGIPGINTLYGRTMTFMKSVTDEDGKARAESHPTEKEKKKDGGVVISFKTTQYPYALPFRDEEDSHGLPLSGIVAGFARIVDYQKAFFEVSDWYSEMNTRILACLRRVIATVSYDDDIVGRNLATEQNLPTFSERLWQALNAAANGGPSIIDKLRETCGIEVESVVLRSIDPPADWRATTLAPYKAQREKDAAVHQAEASATLFDDTNQALKVWLECQHAAGYKPTQAQIDAKQDELRQRALAKTPGYQQIHVKGLENASTAVVGGGGAGVLLGGKRGGRDDRGGSGKDSGRSSGGQKSEQVAQEQAAQKYFDRHHRWPSWWDSTNKRPF